MIYSNAVHHAFSHLPCRFTCGTFQDNLRLDVFSEGDTYIQALLAAISLGPVGLSDELEGYPSPPAPNASIVTNASLALSLCTSNGSLLGPSIAATPVDGHLRCAGDLGGRAGNVWTTYTAVDNALGGTAVWFMAVGFGWNESNASLAPYPLTDIDFAPLLDGACSTPADFATIPCGGFLGSGSELPGAFVAWDPASSALPVAFGGLSPPFALALALHTASVVHVSPVWPGGIVLLGELNKTVPLSAYRFASVSSMGSGLLRVSLRGAAEEAVILRFALAPFYEPVIANVTLGSDGTATISLPQ